MERRRSRSFISTPSTLPSAVCVKLMLLPPMAGKRISRTTVSLRRYAAGRAALPRPGIRRHLANADAEAPGKDVGRALACPLLELQRPSRPPGHHEIIDTTTQPVPKFPKPCRHLNPGPAHLLIPVSPAPRGCVRRQPRLDRLARPTARCEEFCARSQPGFGRERGASR